MNRPPIATYVIGNPVVALVILAGSGFGCYLWWIGQASGWVPLLALLATGAALNASERLGNYQNWKRAWDAMGGDARPRRRLDLRLVIGLPLWLVFAIGVAGLDRRQPENVLAIACFVVGSLGMFAVVLYRRRPPSSARPSRPNKEVPVAISLAVPRASPGGKDLYTGLPDYCGRLK